MFFIIYILANKKIKLGKEEKRLLVLAIYLFVVDIVSIISMLINDNLYALNEFLPIKAVKGYIFFFTNVVFFILLTNIQERLADPQKIFKPFLVSYFLLFIVLIIEKIAPALLNCFHTDSSYFQSYGRIRLLTAENSYTGTLIALYFSLSYYYVKNVKSNNLLKGMVLAIFVIFICMNSSKGFLGTLLLSFAILAVFNSAINKKLIVLFMILLLLLGPNLYRSILTDIQKYTSVTTRLYFFISAVMVMIENPLGIGNAMYLIVYVEELKSRLDILNRFVWLKNFSEINTIINYKTDDYIAAKSGIIQYGMYWGVIGTLIFINFFKDIYINLKKTIDKNNGILQFGLIFLFISILAYVDFDTKYEIFSYLTVVVYYIRNSQKILKKD